ATPKPTPAAENVLSLIHQLINTKNIDPHRIYLTGYSMGGEGTFDLAGQEPALFACAVPLASVADTANASKLKDIPFWVFHGTEDNVNPFKYSKLMVEAMKKQGSHPLFTEVKNTGHDCRNAAYLNPELWNWVFKQERND
ncbi:MAG: prolyl oligopeptidase family serine peptidase, partial [Bacteroidia bacterium]|nr:prolyl oligopeptidase family serine peptidase [Bacteroidia bacterium]